ncbi:hypothetical protein Mpe_A0376 [Methylibium petroleiphilum PM1]|uniref:Uncharacterized protein n=1 Tax=Methylibium petroleiphilum (strain ATCC BAA-1232 / LMG 22953 / PM1) TaxID=420662 RepID=A2SCP9_METPP|nr:hypothetical protein Mpe_A0376 [Methylibium petroleiphilum PM1]
MWALCGLTFELSRPWRHGALAAKRMINMTGSRPRCHAGAGRLERIRRDFPPSGHGVKAPRLVVSSHQSQAIERGSPWNRLLQGQSFE